MWDMFSRLRLVALGFGVLAAGSIAEGSNISFRAVKKNDIAITPTNNLAVLGNDKIEVEMILTNWINDFSPGGAADRVRTYQVKINRAGFIATDNGSSKPFGWCGPVDQIPCTQSATCPGEYPTCLTDPPVGCICTPHTPETGGFITADRSDFLFFGIDGPAPTVVTSTIDYKYFTVVENPAQAVADTGVPRYLGTLILKVTPNACGTFTIGHVQDISATFLSDPSLKPITSLPSLTPLTLTVSDCSRQLLSCSPIHCNIDARIAHDRLDQNSKRNAFQITMTFSKSTTSPNMTPADFEVTVLPFNAQDPVPEISSLTPNPGDSKITTLNFLPRIQQTRWTCIRDKGSNKRCCMGSLPPDADNSRISQLDDVFELNDNLLGIVNPVLAIEKSDIDRSALRSPADLLMAVDVLTGADAFDPTSGDSIPALIPACPSMNMPP